MLFICVFIKTTNKVSTVRGGKPKKRVATNAKGEIKMNKVNLIGNLTHDPELSNVGADKTSVCKFSIAVNRNYKNADGEHDTDFLQVTAWRELGERVAKYVKKGNKVAVSGEIRTGSHEAKDGTTKYTTEILANEVEFLTPKPKENEKDDQQDEEKENKKTAKAKAGSK